MSAGQLFDKVLIANRGEIALRIIRACRELGIETVCVIARPTPAASICSWPTRPSASARRRRRQSYLKIPQIISAAEVGNVQAIHPGYGFLVRERPLQRGLPQLQDRLHRSHARGDGAAGRQERGPQAGPQGRSARRARQRGPDDRATPKAVARLRHEIGFPVLIKATAGGGGRGMRVAAERPGAQDGAAASPRRGEARPSATGGLPGKIHRDRRGTSKCRCSPIITATSCICGSATARRSAGIRS